MGQDRPPGHHTRQLGTERGAHTNPILGLGLRAQLCPAGDGPTCQKTQLRTAMPTPCTVRKTHLSPAGLISAPLLTPDLVLHQHTPQPGLSAGLCDHRAAPRRGHGTPGPAPGPGMDLPGPGSATPPHPTAPRERHRVGRQGVPSTRPLHPSQERARGRWRAEK